MTFSSARWTDAKAALAERLFRGECGGSYAEAVLITCAAISAVAAVAWPGERIDRMRFVELLVRVIRETQTISIPLLYLDLVNKRRRSYARRLREEFLPSSGSLVIAGPDVDRQVVEIRAICPKLLVSELRQFSYANLLYQRLRSPMTHQYQTGKQTVPYSMTERTDVPISYYNWAYDPEEKRPRRPERGKSVRHIYFHIPWLAGLTREVGKQAAAASGTYPLARPAKWWIQG